ncbi:MAG: hypothetical protein U0R50_05075 [Gaiellales bacterium]
MPALGELPGHHEEFDEPVEPRAKGRFGRGGGDKPARDTPRASGSEPGKRQAVPATSEVFRAEHGLDPQRRFAL